MEILTVFDENDILKEVCKKALERTPLVIAIDGECASGKTYLADYLRDNLDASIIRADDFFVPLNLRDKAHTEVKIHYERIASEVLPFLKSDTDFSYQKFSCNIMDYSGSVLVPKSSVIIIEGSYCMAPVLGKYYDMSIYTRCDMKVRMERLAQRCNNGSLYRRFIEEWIPAEDYYDQKYNIRGSVDILLDTSSK